MCTLSVTKQKFKKTQTYVQHFLHRGYIGHKLEVLPRGWETTRLLCLTIFETGLTVSENKAKDQAKVCGVKDLITFKLLAHAKGNPAAQTRLKKLEEDTPSKVNNTFLKLKAFDGVGNTPVESLHVILLGIGKYLAQDLVAGVPDRSKYKLVVRLQSFNIILLNTDSLKPDYLIKHIKSLIGRDFKIILQAAPFVFAEFMSPGQKHIWSLHPANPTAEGCTSPPRNRRRTELLNPEQDMSDDGRLLVPPPPPVDSSPLALFRVSASLNPNERGEVMMAMFTTLSQQVRDVTQMVTQLGTNARGRPNTSGRFHFLTNTKVSIFCQSYHSSVMLTTTLPQELFRTLAQHLMGDLLLESYGQDAQEQSLLWMTMVSPQRHELFSRPSDCLCSSICRHSLRRTPDYPRNQDSVLQAKAGARFQLRQVCHLTRNILLTGILLNGEPTLPRIPHLRRLSRMLWKHWNPASGGMTDVQIDRDDGPFLQVLIAYLRLEVLHNLLDANLHTTSLWDKINARFAAHRAIINNYTNVWNRLIGANDTELFNHKPMFADLAWANVTLPTEDEGSQSPNDRNKLTRA
ncbi:hypothetical protein PSTT_00796 [Puccinia striiformis]|uniref:Uncharacterized protein n=1 Tax=Puccinia striiformis TaxID=27350 RepID=A0A2S4W5I2_9BASI|nr:hypothetical protein PSTT_00796 [Puccinia striiformis]